LIRVENFEVIGVGAPRAVSSDLPARVAPLRVLDLHHFGAQPCQGLGAGGAGLELRQVDDLYAFQAVKGGKISAHPVGLLHSRNVASTTFRTDNVRSAVAEIVNSANRRA